MSKTWTITFSESVENHVGMQQIGTRAASGVSCTELDTISAYLTSINAKSELYNLASVLPKENQTTETEAKLLIVRNGVELLMGSHNKSGLCKEIYATEEVVNKKVWMRGAVKNKNARWNCYFADTAQEPNYEAKQGRIVAYSSMPFLSALRSQIGNCFGAAFQSNESKRKFTGLNSELNLYYDINKTGIGFHGDTERRIVIGVRFGATMNLQYQWFHNWKPIASRMEFMLAEGDLYIMSEKTVGTDWKSPSKLTLRHAAGCSKYTTI